MRLHHLLASSFVVSLIVACGGSSDDASPSGSAGSSQAGSAGSSQAGAAGQSGGAGGATGGVAGQTSGGAGGNATAGSPGTGGAAMGAGAAGAAGSAPSAGKGGVAGSMGGTSAKAGSGGAVVGGSPPFTSVVAPPPDPNAQTITGTATLVLAASKWTLTEPSSAYSDNLDGKHFTDANDPTHCAPRAGAKKKDIVLDGANGEDNSFARNLAPIFEALSGNFSGDLDGGITSGGGTLVVRVRNLGPGVAYNGLSVDGLGALGDEQNPPTSFGGYAWRPLANQLTSSAGTGDALVASSPAKVAYTAGNVLVAQEIKDMTLPLVAFSGAALMVPIHDARLIASLSPDHQAIISGRAAGVIPVVALSNAFRNLAGKISPSLCSGSALDGVIAQIEGASDMMANGTQDGAATCDGVSFGIGLQGLASGVGASAPLDTTVSCP